MQIIDMELCLPRVIEVEVAGPVPAEAHTPTYTGPYEMTPKHGEDSILHTAGKRMSTDVKLRKVPYSSVSNQSGGKTIYIG